MRFTQQQTRTYIAEQAAELAKLAAGVKLKEAARSEGSVRIDGPCPM